MVLLTGNNISQELKKLLNDLSKSCHPYCASKTAHSRSAGPSMNAVPVNPGRGLITPGFLLKEKIMEKKNCKNCEYYNTKKVIQPKDLGLCENKESRKHKELLPVYSSCGKFSAKTGTSVMQSQP